MERLRTAEERKGVGAREISPPFSHWVSARSLIGNKMSEITLEPLGRKRAEGKGERRRTITLLYTHTRSLFCSIHTAAAVVNRDGRRGREGGRDGAPTRPNNKTGRSGTI